MLSSYKIKPALIIRCNFYCKRNHCVMLKPIRVYTRDLQELTSLSRFCSEERSCSSDVVKKKPAGSSHHRSEKLSLPFTVIHNGTCEGELYTCSSGPDSDLFIQEVMSEIQSETF